jgi:hypothetical protein
MVTVGSISVTVPVEVVWPSPAPTRLRAAGQRGAVHVARPAGHRRPGVDVLRDRVLDEALGRAMI